MAADLLTFNQACEALRVSRTTLYDYMRRGFPAPVRVGSRPMFFASEVKGWIESRPRISVRDDAADLTSNLADCGGAK